MRAPNVKFYMAVVVIGIGVVVGLGLVEGRDVHMIETQKQLPMIIATFVGEHSWHCPIVI